MTNVFWVHASTKARFEEAYKNIARQIHVRDLEDPNLLRLVRERLESNDVPPWLLILDNADDVSLFFGSPAIPGSCDQPHPERPLWEYLPRTAKGALLITSRDARVGTRLVGGRGVISVGALGAEEGRGLVCKRLHNDDLDGEYVERLLETLEYVPLAISQATAFIQENCLGVKEYLEILLKGDAEMNDLLHEEYHDPARDPEIQNSIFRTWRISFEQVLKQSPRAAEILFLIAVLDRQSVPKSLLEKEGENPINFWKALGTIQAFSLISAQRGGAVYEMHRLVHLFVRNWLDAEGKRVHWEEEGLTLLDARLPWDFDEDRANWESLRPHAEAVLYRSVTRQPSDMRRADLLQRLASYERSLGQYEAANRELTEALNIHISRYGSLGFTSLSILNDYARILHIGGRHLQAEKVRRKVLKVVEKKYGSDHGVTLANLICLAIVLQMTGKMEEALSIQVRVLQSQRQTLGSEHLETLHSEFHVASLSCKMGQYEEAERLHRQVLPKMEELVGPSYEMVIFSRYGLVCALRLQDKLEEAEGLARNLVDISIRTRGPDHPGTPYILVELGRVLSRTQDEEAEKVYRTAISGLQQLGRTYDRQMVEYMEELEVVLRRRSKASEADELLKQIKTVKEVAPKETVVVPEFVIELYA